MSDWNAMGFVNATHPPWTRNCALRSFSRVPCTAFWTVPVASLSPSASKPRRQYRNHLRTDVCGREGTVAKLHAPSAGDAGPRLGPIHSGTGELKLAAGLAPQ